jgi:predicted secreted protein
VLTVSVDPVSTVGGGSLRGLVGLATPAPAGGATVFLSSDNPVAHVPARVSIAAGNSATTFTVATDSVASYNAATITATTGASSKSAIVTVFPDPNPPPPPAAVVDLAIGGVPSTIRRGQTFTATATVTNTGTSTASGYSVAISLSPSSSLRLQSPTSSTQPVGPVASGTSQSVAWQIRADKTASATVTMTLRNASGAVVRTVRQTIAVTN